MPDVDLLYRGHVKGRVQFGQFDFDPAAGVLRRNGTPVRLQPQPARVLAMLVERAGDLVGRDDLRQGVWPDGTFVDFERGLNFCIAQIRAALADTASAPRFVETVPRRGYRFIAPVRPVLAEVVPLTQTSSLNRRLRPATPIAYALLVLLVTSLVAFAWPRQPREPVRIAVVPFDNETGNPAMQDIGGGIADATVARLAAPERLPSISVIGNASLLRRPREFRDLQEIGKQLDVQYVVLAQVKRDEAGVRLIAHLIRVRDQAHLWAETFDRPAFTLEAQQEIAEAIATAVADQVTRPPGRANTTN